MSKVPKSQRVCNQSSILEKPPTTFFCCCKSVQNGLVGLWTTLPISNFDKGPKLDSGRLWLLFKYKIVGSTVWWWSLMQSNVNPSLKCTQNIIISVNAHKRPKWNLSNLLVAILQWATGCCVAAVRRPLAMHASRNIACWVLWHKTKCSYYSHYIHMRSFYVTTKRRRNIQLMLCHHQHTRYLLSYIGCCHEEHCARALGGLATSGHNRKQVEFYRQFFTSESCLVIKYAIKATFQEVYKMSFLSTNQWFLGRAINILWNEQASTVKMLDFVPQRHQQASNARYREVPKEDLL